MVKNDAGFIDIPIPVIMRVPDFGSISEKTLKGWLSAAKRLETLLALPVKYLDSELSTMSPYIVPIISAGDMALVDRNDNVRLVEYIWDEKGRENVEKLRELFPSALVSARLELKGDYEKTAREILEAGCSIINLEGSYNGRGKG